MNRIAPFALVLFALLSLPAVPGSRDEIAGLSTWVLNPLIKVKPQDPPPATPRTSAEIFAGRNEFEPFQLVLRAESQDLPNVDVQVSDLRSPNGSILAKDNITVYLVGFLDLQRPSSIEGGTGLWPDPLIPRVDRYARETRNAFPFALSQGRNQPVWIEVFVPPKTAAGRYEGEILVSQGRQAQHRVPVVLTVWNFTLPSTASLKSSFGFNGVTALKQHRGTYTSDEDLHSLTRLYAKAALLHRLSIHGGSMAPPKFWSKPGRLRVDWSFYDEEVGPFLDGTAIAKGEPLAGARWTSVELRSSPALTTEEEKVLYWTEWVRHFEQKSWLDRLFLYLWDEPPVKDFSKVVEAGLPTRRVEPKVKTLVTVNFSERLADVVDIWVPLVNCLDPKPGPETFCEEHPPRGVYAGGIGRGKSLWFYQSCGSHGCSIVGQEYFTGWPSYMIDISGLANRVMQWVAWKYDIEGELYYNMNQAYNDNLEPWDNVHISGGNGDGTLFYPGQPSRIGGRTHIPIESIRLKLIREGMEDYEYLALLAQRGRRDAADEFAGRIVRHAYRWESQPEVFLRARQQMGELLHGQE